MAAVRSIVNTRSTAFVSALLLSTAFTVPAFAAIETVVVTAQKRAEDIQTVPISVTAFEGKDLQSKQITSFKDLQFNMPSLTYSQGALGGANISIRGIGSAAVSLSGDSGVAFNENEIYQDASSFVATSTYFDLERVEVLRGPQSTLYGRNATGGAFNAITAKPDLETFMVSGEATYGNFDDKEVRAVVNLPIMDGKLGLRIAGFGELRNGDIKNVWPGTVNTLVTTHGSTKALDSRDDFSGRASLRWQPTEDTTIDLIAEHSQEADTRLRTVIGGCVRDPSGVFGCLPTGIARQAINNNAVITNTFTSDIGPLAASAVTGGLVLTQIGNTGPTLSLGGLGQPTPQDYHTVTADFLPSTQNFYNTLQFIWHQKLNDELTLDVHADYDNNHRVSSQGALGTQGDSLFYDGTAATLANQETAQQFGTLAFLASVPGGSCAAAVPTIQRLVAAQEILACADPLSFAEAGYAGHLGQLPISGPYNFGISGANPPAYYSDHSSSFDHQDAGSSQYSAEARILTNFAGPMNFLLAAYHLETRLRYNYEISSSSLDLTSVLVGASAGNGIFYGPSNYNNNNTAGLSTSAVFAEAYYTILPDELKFTGGLRLTSDNKTYSSQNALFNCFFPPVAFAGNAAGLAAFISNTAPGNCGSVLPPTTSTSSLVVRSANFSAMTGRAVLDWTPKLDFTDATLIYASYSRGYRAGGFNPAAAQGAIVSYGVTFKPESVDALEFGTKNTLFDGTLQANLDFWYYDYKNYQISATINKTAINQNINSQLWGAEGEFLWLPDEHWTFNFNFAATDSKIGSVAFVDPRNPSQNDPNTAVVKDYLGANCVIINTLGTGAPSPVAGPGLYTHAGLGTPVTGILVPAAVNSIAGVAAGVSYVNGNHIVGASCGNLQAKLDTLYGGHALDPLIATDGIAKNIGGNKQPNTPPLTLGVGVQYMFNFDGYSLVPRVDYYWKGADFYNYFNAATDRIPSWDETNAQIQLNAPDDVWYARAWVKNAFDKGNITGGGAGDQSQGLANGFSVEPPRTYGISLGAHF